MGKKIDFFHVSVSPKSIEYATEVLQSGFLNEGEYVRKFENELARIVGQDVAGRILAVSSCTAAMHLALLAENIGPGDEVILPSQTFVATATVVLQSGATPVLADINPRTGNIDLVSIEKKITSRTKAIMPVHFGGLPCEMDQITRIAKDHKLVVIEDAAHAFGSRYKGKMIGGISDYTCFSFQAIKMLTCGDGGAIVCPENKISDVVSRKWFGINKNNVKSKYNEKLPSMDRLGFKYNMNNIAAAIGCGNVEDVMKRIARRREIANIYRNEFCKIPGLELLDIPTDVESCFWLFPILVQDKERFFNNMVEKGIQVKMVNWGIDREPIFQYDKSLPGQRYFDDHHLCIPCNEGLSDSDVEYIIESVKKA